VTAKLAPRNGEEAAAFLRRQHDTGAKWPSLCLSLQRQARGLPAVFPSAVSAAAATPKSERVEKVADLRRGMIAYSDDPNDGNPFGHIYFILGWKNPKERSDASTLLTWTNLAGGAVGIVPITYYRSSWGDGFQFGATWLNGYDFADFNAKPKPVKKPVTLGKHYENAMEDLHKAIVNHRKQGHDRLVARLTSDYAKMKALAARYN